jgi:hypothetical protein
MKAIVKNIRKQIFKTMKYGTEISFVPYMEEYIGKEIDVKPIKKEPGFYTGKGWWWHKSWLKFSKE